MNTTTMPEYDDMLARLNTIPNDDYTKQGFYPYVLKDAGRELAAGGVVMMLTLAIADFTQGMPAIVGWLLSADLKSYIIALVDDEVVQAEALQFVDEVEAKMKAERH